MTSPLVIHEVAELVLDCVCDQMNAIAGDLAFDGYGCPCRAYVSPGTPAWENCCEHCGEDDAIAGQLTVEVHDVYRTSKLGVRELAIDICEPNQLVIEVVVTVVRCGPSMDEAGRDPAPEKLTAASEMGHVDLWAILMALECCVAANAPAGRAQRDVRVTRLRPLGERGGCVGFEVTALIAAGDICRCPEGS